MKLWLDPDLSDNEYKFILFSWWDNLPEHQKTKALRASKDKGTN